MKKTVKFLSFFDTQANASEKRYFVLSATNKMQSIFDVLNQIGYDVEIISMSSTCGNKNCPNHLFTLNEHVTLRLFASIARVNIFAKILDYVVIRLQFLWYLIFHIKKDELVFAYHSLKYIKLILFLKKVKKFKLVLEMEELYSNVSGRIKTKKLELKLANMTDAFIFPTELLNKSVNKNQKPSIIIHGTYHVEEERVNKLFTDDYKIHIVYAGTLDPTKGGAVASVKAASILPTSFHIHILGFGTSEQIDNIRDLAKEVSQGAHARVTYDGLLSGEEYIQFLQSCQIGLSTQNPNGAFNDTSFPSKILSYMANGLRVVSIGIEAVKKSAVGDMITYYYEQTPESIAKAILEVDFTKPYDSRKRIRELNEQFQHQLSNLIEVMNK